MNNGEGHNSVLGSRGVINGKMKWRINIESIQNNSNWIAIGVAHSNISGTTDYNSSYSLSSYNQKYPGRSSSSAKSGAWISGDFIEVNLDCDLNTLLVKNLRTQKSENWSLPPANGDPWYLYVNLYNNGDCVSISS